MRAMMMMTMRPDNNEQHSQAQLMNNSKHHLNELSECFSRKILVFTLDSLRLACQFVLHSRISQMRSRKEIYFELSVRFCRGLVQEFK